MVLLRMSENRSLERFDLELPAKVEIIPEDEEAEVQILNIFTKDICAGGAFFRAECQLPEGTKVNIDLVMPLENLKELTGKHAYIEVSGYVVRNGDEGFAIRFEPDYRIKSI